MSRISGHTTQVRATSAGTTSTHTAWLAKSCVHVCFRPSIHRLVFATEKTERPSLHVATVTTPCTLLPFIDASTSSQAVLFASGQGQAGVSIAGTPFFFTTLPLLLLRLLVPFNMRVVVVLFCFVFPANPCRSRPPLSFRVLLCFSVLFWPRRVRWRL